MWRFYGRSAEEAGRFVRQVQPDRQGQICAHGSKFSTMMLKSLGPSGHVPFPNILAGGRRKIQVCRMNGDITEIDLRDDSVRDLVKHLKMQDASLENQDVKLLLSRRELSENYKLQNIPLSERLIMVIKAPSRPAALDALRAEVSVLLRSVSGIY